MKKWEDEKKLENDLTTMVVNFILAKVHLKSLELGQDLGLPPHIPLPHVKAQSNSNNQENNDQSKDSKKSEYSG